MGNVDIIRGAIKGIYFKCKVLQAEDTLDGWAFEIHSILLRSDCFSKYNPDKGASFRTYVSVAAINQIKNKIIYLERRQIMSTTDFNCELQDFSGLSYQAPAFCKVLLLELEQMLSKKRLPKLSLLTYADLLMYVLKEFTAGEIAKDISDRTGDVVKEGKIRKLKMELKKLCQKIV